MERTEVCSVHAKKRGIYYVKLTKNAECEGCKMCGFGRKNYLVLPAQSQFDCDVGDSVVVKMPEKSVKGSYLYLYLIPLIAMFAGLMIPYGYGEKFMMIGCAIGLCVGIAVAYCFERLFRRSKKYLPQIVEKYSDMKENEQ